MDRFRFSPEREVLQRLFAGAGVHAGASGSGLPSRERIGFAAPIEAAHPSPVAATPARPVPGPGPLGTQVAAQDPFPGGIESQHDISSAEPTDPGDLPTTTELSDEQLGIEVFGAQAAGLGVEVRLDRFLQWVIAATGAFAAFVADPEGLPLANRDAPDSYVAAIGPLGRAQMSIARFVPTSQAGSSIFELDHGQVLQVVWSATSVGKLAVGLVLPGALEGGMTQRIRRITQLAI